MSQQNSSASDSDSDRRRSPRMQVRFDTLISAGATEGAGALTDISYSGARLDDSSIRPPVGSNVRLYVFVQPVAPFELVGTVFRHTETGFAIRYELCDADTRRLVDDVTALVSNQPTS